jgi:hypothetical protein
MLLLIGVAIVSFIVGLLFGVTLTALLAIKKY